MGFDKTKEGKEIWYDWIGLLEWGKGKMTVTHWLKIFKIQEKCF